jgi:hypothetical protein
VCIHDFFLVLVYLRTSYVRRQLCSNTFNLATAGNLRSIRAWPLLVIYYGTSRTAGVRPSIRPDIEPCVTADRVLSFRLMRTPVRLHAAGLGVCIPSLISQQYLYIRHVLRDLGLYEWNGDYLGWMVSNARCFWNKVVVDLGREPTVWLTRQFKVGGPSFRSGSRFSCFHALLILRCLVLGILQPGDPDGEQISVMS